MLGQSLHGEGSVHRHTCGNAGDAFIGEAVFCAWLLICQAQLPSTNNCMHLQAGCQVWALCARSLAQTWFQVAIAEDFSTPAGCLLLSALMLAHLCGETRMNETLLVTRKQNLPGKGT